MADSYSKKALDDFLATNPYAKDFGYGPKPPVDPATLGKPAKRPLYKPPAPIAPELLGKPATPPSKPLSTTLSEGVNTAGRGFVRGGLEAVGSTLRGLAGQMTVSADDAREMERLGLIQLDPNKPLEQQVETRPPQELGPYKLGEAISGVAQRPDLAPPPGWQNGWTDAIAGAFGSTSPYLALGALGAGPSLAAGTITGMWAGAGQAMDDAIQHGATPDQILQAAHLGQAPGATETLPMEVLFRRLPLGQWGRFASVFGHVLASAAAEGGQEGAQQAAQNLIAKWVYDPKRDLMDQVAENAALGAIVGGGTAAVTHAFTGKPETPPPPPGPPSGAAAGAPPGAGAPLSGQVIPPEPGAPPPGNIGSKPTIDLTATDVTPRAPRSGGAPPEVDLPVVPGWQTTEGGQIPRIELNLSERDRYLREQGGTEPPQIAPPPALPPVTPAGALPQIGPPKAQTGQEVLDPSTLGRPARPDRRQMPTNADNSTTIALPDQSGGPEGLGRPVRGGGERHSPALVTAPGDVDRAAAHIDQSATDAQLDAENAKVGHLQWDGGETGGKFGISLETPPGGERRSTDPKNPWVAKMAPGVSYGRFKGVKSRDGSGLDVYIGPNPASKQAFIIDQVEPDNGRYDEGKTFIGFDTEDQARDAYEQSFSDERGGERIGSISTLPIGQFKEWLNSGRTTLPFDHRAVAGVRKARRAALEGKPVGGVTGLERHNAISAEADRRWPPRVETSKKGEKTSYVEHNHIAFRNGAEGYGPMLGMPIHVKLPDIADAYEAGVKFSNSLGSPAPPGGRSAAPAWWNELTTAGRAPLIAKASSTLSPKTAWHNLSSDNQQKITAAYEASRAPTTAADLSTVEPHLLLEMEEKGGEAGKAARAERNKRADAPTWAEILHALPKDVKGRPDLDIAANLMSEIGGKRRYSDLTADQQTEMLRRVKERQPVEKPVAEEHIQPEKVADEQPGPGIREETPGVPESEQPANARPTDTGGSAGLASEADRPAGSKPLRDGERADGEQPEPAGGVQRPGEGAGSDTADGGRADDERDSEPAAAAEPAGSVDDDTLDKERRARRKLNYRITPDDKIGQGNAREKVEANLAAIRLLKKVEQERRDATTAEKRVLVKYVGWGAFAQDVFAQHKGEWAKQRTELKDLLTAEEYAAARASTLNAHYTSESVTYSIGKRRSSTAFFSAVVRAVESAKITKSTPDQWLGYLRNQPGVKTEELAWLGVEDWLASQGGSVTKAALADFVRANQVSVQEVEKGNDDSIVEAWWNDEGGANEETPFNELSPAEQRAATERYREEAGQYEEDATKYAIRQLPGGENYRELLLTLPERAGGERGPKGWGDTAGGTMDTANFRGAHWDEPNVLAHVRFNDRTAGGKRTLFIEEIQSDWHQAGRKRGYRGGNAKEVERLKQARDAKEKEYKVATDQWRAAQGDQRKVLYEKLKDIVTEWTQAIDAWDAANQANAKGGVPDAPFKTTWPELALKRMIRWAAENGYDQVAWTPGSVQTERYWGNQTVSAAVDRFKKIAEPESVRKLAEDVFGREMASLMPLNEMDGGVLAVLKHDQVKRAVISHLSVDVVNILRAAHLSPDQLFSKNNVVADRLSVDDRSRVIAGVLGAAKLTATAIRAKLRGLKAGGSDLELLPALRASQLNSREVAGLLSPRSLFHLGAGSAPEEAAATRARAEAASGQSDKLTPAELADFLNAHLAIVHGNAWLLNHGFEVPPGTGMDAFYDRMLPSIANKLGKKFGAKVGTTKIGGANKSDPVNFAEYPDGINMLNGDGEFLGTVSTREAAEEALRDVKPGLPVHSLPITDAMRDSVMQGQPLFQPGQPSKAQQTAREEVLAIIKQVAGDDVAVEFTDKLFAGAGSRMSQWGAAATDEAAGSANKIDRLIRISLNPEFEADASAYHEAYHLIEDLKTRQERDLIRRELPRLRGITAKDMGLSEVAAATITAGEVEAQAFAAYAQGKARGLHVGIRAFFAKLLKIIRRIRNMMQGLGFQTAEDFFDAALRGEVQERGLEDAPAAGEQFSRGRPRHPDPYAFFVTPEDRIILRRFLHTISAGIIRNGFNATLFRRNFQDRADFLKKLEASIEDAGATLSQDEQAYRTESLYYGRSGELGVKLRIKYVEPMMRRASAAGIERKEADDFLKALHAEERNAKIRPINPAIPDPSGMSDMEARAIKRAVLGGPNAAAFMQLSDDVQEINRFTSDLQYNSGLISQAEYDSRQHANGGYRYYVPLRGWEADQVDDGIGGGSGYDVRGPESHQAMGRLSPADSPLAYVLMQAKSAIVRSEKNRVALTLGRLASQYRNKQVWEVNRSEKKRRINAAGMVEEYWVAPQAVAQMDREHVIVAKSRGKATYISIHDKRLVTAMRMKGASEMGAFVSVLARITSTMSKFFTSYDPDFVLRNIMRDVQTGMTYMGEHDIKRLRLKVLRDMPAASTGMYRYLRGSFADNKHPWLRLAREYAEGGGKISFADYESLDAEKRRIDQALNRRGVVSELRRGRPDRAGLQVAGDAVGWIEDVNGAAENAMRLSLYVNLRRAGVPKEAALSAGRELTTNFNRKGEFGPIVNAFYMFSGASTQGTVRLMQFVKRNPKAATALFLAMAALGAAQDWWNYMIAGEDPETGKNFWDEVPSYEKQRNFIIMQPGTGKYLVRIPMGYGINVFPVLGASVMAGIRNKAGAGAGMQPLDAAINVATAASNGFLPFDVGGGMFTPTIIKPFMEIKGNRDYKGSPIAPDKTEPTQPNWQLFYKGNNVIWQDVAKELAAWSTLDERKGPEVDVSPEWLEHLFNSYLGGAGQFWFQRIGANAAKILQGDITSIETRDIPFVRTFRGDVNDYTQTNAYYDLRDQVKRIEDSPNKARYPVEKAAINAFNVSEATQAKWRRLRKQIEANTSLTSEERDAKVQAVNDHIQAARMKAIAEWEKARKRFSRPVAPEVGAPLQ